MYLLRRETPAHVFAREALLDACFGPERFAKTCERLRAGRRPAPGLAFVALENRELIGTLRLWPVVAGSAGPALLLGPLGVAGDRRGRGIGHDLVVAALDKAARRGHRAVLLVGDAPYYARFGFSDRFTAGLELPGPVDRARFLGLELVAGALAGAAGPVAPRPALIRAARAAIPAEPANAGAAVRPVAPGAVAA